MYYCGQKSLEINRVALIVNKRIWNTILGCSLKNEGFISFPFQCKPFNITVIQVYALWSENICCHNKQEMPQSSAISGLQMWMRSPKTVIQWMLPPPMLIAEKLGESKKPSEQGNRIWPQITRCIRKEWIQWGQRLPSSETQSAKISIFDVQTACSLCCKLVYSLTSASASLEQFSQSYWEAVFWAWSPKHPHQKNNSTLRL